MHTHKCSVKKDFLEEQSVLRKICRFLIFFAFLCLSIATQQTKAQTITPKVEVPDWALPGSASHTQVPPPADFHRTTRTEAKAIGIFTGQSDVGAALMSGSSDYNPVTKQYRIVSAGYNVWYQRDEFRYLWVETSGDVSLSADVDFPDTAGYDDRKAFVVIRQSLDDDSKEAVVALHGGGLLHLAWRPQKGQLMKEVRINHRKGMPDLIGGQITRIGIQKRGDSFQLSAGTLNDPIHQAGDVIQLHLDPPFYVGIGFCSHLPAKTDTALFSKVILVNPAGTQP